MVQVARANLLVLKIFFKKLKYATTTNVRNILFLLKSFKGSCLLIRCVNYFVADEQRLTLKDFKPHDTTSGSAFIA